MMGRVLPVQVSRLQVAELIASAVTNPGIAENKVRIAAAPARLQGSAGWSPAQHGAMCAQVLEVVAETDALQRPYEELLAQAPSDITQADKLAQREAARQRQQQLDAALERVRLPGLLPATVLHLSRQYALMLHVAHPSRPNPAAGCQCAGPKLVVCCAAG